MPDLDLLDVDVLELLLHLLDAGLHGVDGRLGVLEALRRVVGLLHVERLVAQVIALRLVLLLLLQNSQGLEKARQKRRLKETFERRVCNLRAV